VACVRSNGNIAFCLKTDTHIVTVAFDQYSALFTRKLVAIIKSKKDKRTKKIKHKNIGTWCKEYTKCYKLAR